MLSITSTPLQTKQLIRSTTSMFFIGWEMQYDENGRSCGQLVVGSSTMCPLRYQVSCSFLVKHQITQVTQAPHSPDLVPCDFWLFPKLKSPLKGKRFQTVDEIQESMTGHLMEIARTVWGPKVPTLKGTEAPLSYVQCFLYLSSINVTILHITWPDTFWTDLICSCNT